MDGTIWCVRPLGAGLRVVAGALPDPAAAAPPRAPPTAGVRHSAPPLVQRHSPHGQGRPVKEQTGRSRRVFGRRCGRRRRLSIRRRRRRRPFVDSVVSGGGSSGGARTARSRGAAVERVSRRRAADVRRLLTIRLSLSPSLSVFSPPIPSVSSSQTSTTTTYTTTTTTFPPLSLYIELAP